MENMTNGKLVTEESNFNLDPHIAPEPLLDVTSSLVPSSNLETPTIKKNITINLVTVEEAIDYFKSINFPKDTFNVPTEKAKISELLRWLRSPPKIDEYLKPEVHLIYSLTQCGLDWNDIMHLRILRTIYEKLTGASFSCPLKGSHWQAVGFQGNDPGTDLRAVGLFGLLQFLYLTSTTTLHFGHKLYSVANSDDQPFPLAVLSLNVTNIVLNIFNAGKLNRECNSQKSVINTLNLFYIALLVYMLNSWITQKKTIKDSGYLLKEAERYCGRNVRKVIKDLPQNLKKYELS